MPQSRLPWVFSAHSATNVFHCNPRDTMKQFCAHVSPIVENVSKTSENVRKRPKTSEMYPKRRKTSKFAAKCATLIT